MRPLLPDRYYHIYLSANHPERIFNDDEQYERFLTLYADCVQPAVQTFAYCLLPNHFHFFVRVEASCSLALGDMLATYCSETGASLHTTLTQVPVRSKENYVPLVRYIHQNPRVHDVCTNFREWRWSSYSAHLSQQPTRLSRRRVLGWFYGAEWFEELHWEAQDERAIGYLIRDD